MGDLIESIARLPLNWAQWAALPAIGLVAGILGGLLGIGGGLVIIPALLLLLGQPFGAGSLHIFKIAALATAITLSIPAARQHLRARAVVTSMLPALESFGILGVIAGVLVAAQMSGQATRVLQNVFGAAMLLFVAAQVWLAARRRKFPIVGAACPSPKRWGKLGLLVGFPAGVVSGMLGIGGGAWAVPAQNLGLGIRLQTAIGNSTCMIVGVALSAAVSKSISVAQMADLRWIDGWVLAVFLTPGAVWGGSLGGKLTHRLPVQKVRTIFLVLMAVTSLRLIFG